MRVAASIAIGVGLAIVTASPAAADEASEWIERSHEAVFSAEQVVTCSTPDGAVDGVFELEGNGAGVAVGQHLQPKWQATSGMFKSSDDTTAVSIPTSGDVASGLYEAVPVEADRLLGRKTRSFDLLRDGQLRGTITFDHHTGALVATTSYLADGTVYCSMQTTAFEQPLGLPSTIESDAGDVDGLDPIDPDPSIAPADVDGFVRRDTLPWRSGSATFYSDGYFSFTLFESSSPLHLDESDAVDVDLASGTYRRSFEPGQVIYVWEAAHGGMSLVGDLPPDLAESVLGELAPPERPGVLARLWRRLFR